MTTFRAQRTDGQGWVEGYYYKLSTINEGVITYDSKETIKQLMQEHNIGKDEIS